MVLSIPRHRAESFSFLQVGASRETPVPNSLQSGEGGDPLYPAPDMELLEQI